jgi:cell division protein FtsL
MKTAEKELLLSEVSEVLISKDENVTLSFVISIVSVIMIVLFLFVPKIYISNNIYQTSIEIEKLKKDYLSLKDENNILKNKIATLKYKNGVTH